MERSWKKRWLQLVLEFAHFSVVNIEHLQINRTVFKKKKIWSEFNIIPNPAAIYVIYV